MLQSIFIHCNVSVIVPPFFNIYDQCFTDFYTHIHTHTHTQTCVSSKKDLTSNSTRCTNKASSWRHTPTTAIHLLQHSLHLVHLVHLAPQHSACGVKHFCSLLFRSPVAWLTIRRAADIGSGARNFSSPSLHHTPPLTAARRTSTQSLVVASWGVEIQFHKLADFDCISAGAYVCCWSQVGRAGATYSSSGKRMCRPPSPSALSSCDILHCVAFSNCKSYECNWQ